MGRTESITLKGKMMNCSLLSHMGAEERNTRKNIWVFAKMVIYF